MKKKKKERKMNFKSKYDYQSNKLFVIIYLFDSWGTWGKNVLQIIFLDVSRTFNVNVNVMYADQPLLTIKSVIMDTINVDQIMTDQEDAVVKQIWG